VKNPVGIKSFGLHLRKIREERGLSQQELADNANISRPTIQRIESAKFSVTLDVLLSLSEALEMPLPDLMRFSTEEKH
jgi:transcriptional regulator with XRE-family HTH domain